MAYRSRSKSRTRGRSAPKRRSSSAYKSVRPVAKTVRSAGYTRTAGNYGRFRGNMKPELKWFEGTFHQVEPYSNTVWPNQSDHVFIGNSTNSTSAPANRSLNLIAQGTGAQQRIGRKVTLKHLDFFMEIVGTATSGLTATDSGSHHFRVIIAIDHQTNGTNMSVEDVFSVPAGITAPGGTLVSRVDGRRTLEFSKRFTVLADKRYVINPESGGTDMPGFRKVCVFKTVLNLPILFEDVSGAPVISNVSSNNVFAYVIYEDGFSDASTQSFQGSWRLRYSDV